MNIPVADWLLTASMILRPPYWIQNNALSREWDRELRWLIENGYHFEMITEHRARIGDYEVWIANHPYASFTLGSLRPRRTTIYRASIVLRADMAAMFLRNRRAAIAKEIV